MEITLSHSSYRRLWFEGDGNQKLEDFLVNLCSKVYPISQSFKPHSLVTTRVVSHNLENRNIYHDWQSNQECGILYSQYEKLDKNGIHSSDRTTVFKPGEIICELDDIYPLEKNSGRRHINFTKFNNQAQSDNSGLSRSWTVGVVNEIEEGKITNKFKYFLLTPSNQFNENLFKMLGISVQSGDKYPGYSLYNPQQQLDGGRWRGIGFKKKNYFIWQSLEKDPTFLE